MLTIIIGFFLLVFHPFYVSITSIDFNEKAKTMEVSCRIFYDDLEEAIRAEYKTKIDLIHPADRRRTDSLLADYFGKQLKLGVNGTSKTLSFLGYEIEDDVAWCYLEASNVAGVQRITIDNRILFDQFPKQSNILHVTAYGKRKSAKLDNPMRRAVFVW
ncbi:hypothetical protein SAMN05660226_02764 [Parapedobacter luteus]|uniref:Uncharacterized protein n=1 Tax=Parapedobacter luteus TaxID=623280 RepID=A0A1T5DF33_9SPHI|nr:DUF6702 family protein [Parapedobacter luteus]SKB70100.1 hypothetical protein SAMN05660226_02764 [Parapedobacter luteus]